MLRQTDQMDGWNTVQKYWLKFESKFGVVEGELAFIGVDCNLCCGLGLRSAKQVLTMRGLTYFKKIENIVGVCVLQMIGVDARVSIRRPPNF